MSKSAPHPNVEQRRVPHLVRSELEEQEYRSTEGPHRGTLAGGLPLVLQSDQLRETQRIAASMVQHATGENGGEGLVLVHEELDNHSVDLRTAEDVPVERGTLQL